MLKLGRTGSLLVGIGIAALSACTPENPKPVQRADIIPAPSETRVTASPAPLTAPTKSQDNPAPPPAKTPYIPDPKHYPWLAEGALPKRRDSAPAYAEPIDALHQRISPPPGFTRVTTTPGSFGEWLRNLPLAKNPSPVVTYKGDILLPENHENVAAVVSIDTGHDDLQQCADSVIRLHAEWKWSQGARDMNYKAAAGTAMPYARWMQGERIVQDGNAIRWKAQSKPDPEGGDHASFRRYLDAVFMWANTGALANQASKIKLEQLRPGDFFILPGSPGHAVLVLDMAQNEAGKKLVLLGQGFMPAQSFHVLRPNRSERWFEINPTAEGVQTPFWPAPFPWESLRRLD